MKLLLDTIDTKIIEKFYNLGLLFGVTTNPTLAKRFGMADDIDMIKRIRKVMPHGEIHVEAFGKDSSEIIANAERIRLYSGDTNLVFKVPFSAEGVKAVSELQLKEWKTNLHLIFSINQALLSSSVNSDYICPLVGRLDDVGHDAFENLEKIINSFKKSNSNTKVMVSSVRHPQHVERAFMLGADVVTIPSSVLEKMFNHPLTTTGYEEFKNDIRTMQTIQDIDIDKDCVVDPNMSLKDCLSYMVENKKDSIVTQVKGRVGIYTLGDFKRYLVNSNFDVSSRLDKPISNFVNLDVISLDSSCTYGDIFDVFKENDIRHIVLITPETNKVLGVLVKDRIGYVK